MDGRSSQPDDRESLTDLLDSAARYRRAMAAAPKGGPDGVTLLVLLAIAEVPGRSPAEIARRCALRRDDVTRALRKLRTQGLIAHRNTGPGQRGQEVTSAAGEAAVEAFIAAERGD